MPKINLDKVYKELDRLDGQVEIQETFDKIKSFLTAKVQSKASEYSEIAESYLKLNDKINNNQQGGR